MKKIINKIFLITILLGLNNSVLSKETEKINLEPQTTEQEKNQTNSINEKQTFKEDELETIINNSLNNRSEQTQTEKTIKPKASSQNAAKILAKKLSEYKITGYSTCFDPNFAFILDWQNPEFDVTFKNENGDIKTRTFQANIESIGLKLELAIKFNLIFFIDTDLTLLDTNKKIKLGSGIDFSIGITDITYASFKKHRGGILVLGFALVSLRTLGILNDPVNALIPRALSYTTGGYLKIID